MSFELIAKSKAAESATLNSINNSLPVKDFCMHFSGVFYHHTGDISTKLYAFLIIFRYILNQLTILLAAILNFVNNSLPV